MIPDPREQPTMSVEEFARCAGVSRGLAYEALRRGEVPGAFKLGSRHIIPTAAVLAALGLNSDTTTTTDQKDESGT